MDERNSGLGIEPYVVIVRAAMRETDIHRACDSFDPIEGLSLYRVSDKAGNATHLQLNLDLGGLTKFIVPWVTAVYSAPC
jgi:hypothetical protein